MAFYTIKTRFVPFVLDGSKTFMVCPRMRQLPGPGDVLTLYRRVGPHGAVRLRKVTCRDVRTVVITERRVGIFNRRMDQYRFDLLSASEASMNSFLSQANCKLLTIGENNLFAWKEGFRPYRSSRKKTGRAFAWMVRSLRLAHGFPFLATW